MSENWTGRLSQYKDSWKQAKNKKSESFGATIPDGKYIALISGAEVTESQSSGRLQISWEYTILEGDLAGTTYKSYDGLESEDNLVWLMRKLDKIGYDVSNLDIDDLPDLLEDMISRRPRVRIQLKTKGDFQNTYIDKMVEMGEPTQSDSDREVAPAPAPEPETANNNPRYDQPRSSHDEGTYDDNEEPGVELKVGMMAVYEVDGTEVKGVVTKIRTDGFVSLLRNDTGKTVRIAADKLEVLDE